MGNFFENLQVGLNGLHQGTAADANPEYRDEIMGLKTNANSLVQDSETKAFLDWYNKLDKNLSSETKDYLVQNYWNKQSEEREFQREMFSSSTSYQRAVADLSAAGLNPFLAINSLSGAQAAGGSGSSVSGGLYSARKKQEMSTSGTVIGAVIAALALFAVKFLAK